MKRFLKSAIRNDIVWSLTQQSLGRVSSVYQRMANARKPKPAVDHEYVARREALFADGVVLNGPFRGMKYPEQASAGSTLYPKLLGAYEHELHDVIEEIAQRNYSAVVDVGCAEGYYAVGLGMRIPSAQVFAFDVNERAKELCRNMAQANGVSVEVGDFCDQGVLRNLSLGARAIIVCDCEGYEKQLFDADLVQALQAHDFLIESHDRVDIEMTRNLTRMFSATHEVRTIESVDDILKAYTYEFDQLEGFTLAQRKELLGERRGSIMRWVYAVSKQAGE